MVRRLIIVTFSWLLCLYLPATNAVAASADKGAQGHGALFRIQDGQHTLYLFGTIHVGADNFYPLAPAVTQALMRAPAIALEIDPQQIPTMQAAVQQYGFYPPGKTYLSELPPALLIQTQAALAKYRVGADAVQRFRPWMLASLLTVQEFERKGYRAELAVDGYLADLVRQRGTPVIELEGATTQLALFDALSEAQQNLLLADTIKELDDPDSAAKVVQLAEFWRSGNLSGLQDLLDEMAGDQSFVGRFTKEVLLDQRNPPLADKLAALLKQQNGVFAAIGILHLVGPSGVPALLKQQGYQVERIN